MPSIALCGRANGSANLGSDPLLSGEAYAFIVQAVDLIA